MNITKTDCKHPETKVTLETKESDYGYPVEIVVVRCAECELPYFHMERSDFYD